MTISPNSRIYVAGHSGLAGSAVVRRLQQDGYNNVITKSHKELDLTDIKAVASFFVKERPEFVFLAAAKVGGILANNTYPAEFIRDNLLIEIINHRCRLQIRSQTASFPGQLLHLSQDGTSAP